MDYGRYLNSVLEQAGFSAVKISDLEPRNNMGVAKIVVEPNYELVERPFFWRVTSFDKNSPFLNAEDIYIELIDKETWDAIAAEQFEGVLIIFKNTGSVGFLPFFTRKDWKEDDGYYWVDPKLIQPFNRFVSYYIPVS